MKGTHHELRANDGCFFVSFVSFAVYLVLAIAKGELVNRAKRDHIQGECCHRLQDTLVRSLAYILAEYRVWDQSTALVQGVL